MCFICIMNYLLLNLLFSEKRAQLGLRRLDVEYDNKTSKVKEKQRASSSRVGMLIRCAREVE